MASYSIYIPGGAGPDATQLDRVGLGDLLRENDSNPQGFDVLDHGPDGGRGVIFTWRKNIFALDPLLGYQPQSQKWIPAVPDAHRKLPEKRFWFGYEPARPPVPEDLRRDTTFAGYELKLADGQKWVMPNVLMLPHVFIQNHEGLEVPEVKEKFRTVYEQGMEVFYILEAHLRDKESCPLPATRIREYCGRMLGMNYRLNSAIAYQLRLWDDQNWWGASEATVDFLVLNQIEEEVKKKELADTLATLPPGGG